MALTKIINDETKSFRPVLTDKLVLDAVPTEGSFNGVTSDGVAKAIAEGGGGVPDVANPLYIDTDDAVALRYGSGLYLEDGEDYNDTLAVALSGTGGLYYDTMEDNAIAVQVDPAGGLENFIDDGVQVGLRVKVDGTSIDINANGELEAIGGGGGSSYTAGNGIEISGQNAISAKADASGAISVGSNGIGVITDNATIESEYAATTLTSEDRLGTSPFYIPRSVTVTSSNTCTLKLVPDNTFTITAPAEANGCPLVCRLKTLYSISTWYYTWPNSSAFFYDGNNNAMYLQTGSNTVSSTLTLQDQSFGSTTFAQYFYPASTDWDTILGDGVLCVEFGYAADEFSFVFGTIGVDSSDCHVEIVTDAGAHSTLKVKNPLPASLGTAGQVLTVNSGATGIEWATPSSGGGVNPDSSHPQYILHSTSQGALEWTYPAWIGIPHYDLVDMQSITTTYNNNVATVSGFSASWPGEHSGLPNPGGLQLHVACPCAEHAGGTVHIKVAFNYDRYTDGGITVVHEAIYAERDIYNVWWSFDTDLEVPLVDPSCGDMYGASANWADSDDSYYPFTSLTITLTDSSGNAVNFDSAPYRIAMWTRNK